MQLAKLKNADQKQLAMRKASPQLILCMLYTILIGMPAAGQGEGLHAAACSGISDEEVAPQEDLLRARLHPCPAGHGESIQHRHRHCLGSGMLHLHALWTCNFIAVA